MPHASIPFFTETRFIISAVLKAREYAVAVLEDQSSDPSATVARSAGALIPRHPRILVKGAPRNSGFQKARALGATERVTLNGSAIGRWLVWREGRA